MTKVHTHHAQTTNVFLVAKNTAYGLREHQRLVVKHTYTYFQPFTNDHTMHPQHLLASGMRQTAFNSIKPTAVCLGPSVQSIVLLFGSPSGDSWCMGSYEVPKAGPRDPATLFYPCLPFISSSFSSVLSSYYSYPLSSTQSMFYASLSNAGVGEQETVWLHVSLCWRGRIRITVIPNAYQRVLRLPGFLCKA